MLQNFLMMVVVMTITTMVMVVVTMILVMMVMIVLEADHLYIVTACANISNACQAMNYFLRKELIGMILGMVHIWTGQTKRQ